MGSSSSDDDHKSKKKDHSKAATSSVPPPHIPPGYPPTNMPPGYPPPYGAYPPPPGYHPSTYPYAQPPPAAYYYENHRREPGASCAGCIFSFMLTCLFILFLSSLITYLLVRPEMPRVYVEKFSVTGFTANESFFAGTWDADLRVENPNQKLRLHFERVQSGVIYDHDFVSMTLVNPFFVNKQASTMMKVAMTTNNTVDQVVTQEMARDRKGGSVTFTLRVDTLTTFTSDWWTRQAYLRIVCQELKIGFSGGSRSGSLTDKGPRRCTIFV